MTDRWHHNEPAVRFRMLPTGKVEQRFGGDDVTQFDPEQWAAYECRGEQVRAVRIPKRFTVGADTCRDGWLVVDRRGLVAVSASTFGRDYTLGQQRLGEAA